MFRLFCLSLFAISAAAQTPATPVPPPAPQQNQQQPQPAQDAVPGQEPTFTLGVRVNLVNLVFTVTDKRGRFNHWPKTQRLRPPR